MSGAWRVRLRFYGHAAVGIFVEDGPALLIDPYEPGGFGGLMAYAPITDRFDWVSCSHDHADHCAVDGLIGAPRRVAQGTFGPFEIRRHQVAHDEYEGRRRGGFVDLLEIRVCGLTLLHGADVGQSPTPQLIEALRRPDLWLVPVGGFFTIGAAQAAEWARRLDPRVVIPIHDKRPECGLALREAALFADYIRVVALNAAELVLDEAFWEGLGDDVGCCGMRLLAVGSQENG